MQKKLFFLSLVVLASSSMISAKKISRLCGTVQALKTALPCAKVQLFKVRSNKATLLTQTTADCQGRFTVSFSGSKGERLYLLARHPHRTEIVLASAFVQLYKNEHVVVNELSTVATAYALSQFIRGDEIFGSDPGLGNSFRTIENLVNIGNGKPARVIKNTENGSSKNSRSTRALQTQNTVANMIAGCVGNQRTCTELFGLVTAATGTAVHNTFQAIHGIARYPFTQNNSALFALANSTVVFTPSLKRAPDAWLIALHFVDGGFSAPGRMAFDSRGRVWSNNNFMPPAGSLPNFPGRQVAVINPQGVPILGSPIFSDFVFGSGYGTAVDACDNGWISSFESGQIAQFSPHGNVIQHSNGLNHPMGMAFDQEGNLWIANMADPTNPFDFGSVTVFLHGDLNKRIDHTDGIHKPFSVAIDDQGRCWVANSGFAPVGSVTVLKLTAENTIVVVKKDITSEALNAPIEPGLPRPFDSSFASPKTVAIDTNGNGWVSNLEISKVAFIDGTTFDVTDFEADPRSRGWGLAVDGTGLIWIASFTNPPLGPLFQKPPVISVLQGVGSDRGAFLYSFSNPALQHLTGLQIDSSGNVWVANNWSLATTPTQIVGGDGLVVFIGIASPVKTPLIGIPVAS